MVLEADQDIRPYAATANVMAVLERVRARNLPETLDNNFFRTAGISDIVIGRVRQALRFLDFIQEDDAPTDRLRAYAAAGDARQILESAIRDAYRQDFKNTAPEADGQETILRAFQPYKPRSQTARMVMLWLGLCREAGIPVRDAPRERKMQPATRRRDGRTQAAPKTTPAFHARPPASPQVFGITEDDIAVLNEREFEEVWAALGKIVRAKARAKQEEELTQQLAKEPEEAPEGPES